MKNCLEVSSIPVLARPRESGVSLPDEERGALLASFGSAVSEDPLTALRLPGIPTQYNSTSLFQAFAICSGSLDFNPEKAIPSL